MLSMDEVPMNNIGEYFKINKIKEIYLLKKRSEIKFGLNNCHEIIDNEIYGIIEVDCEDSVTNNPASTTSTDIYGNENSKTVSDTQVE
jgi:hypothetical protein